MSATLPLVSVVVRRMYYWDLLIDDYETWKEFQQLLEECTIGTLIAPVETADGSRFSSCQKNVLLGLQTQPVENKGF